jgi:hypothetical protein
MNNSGSRGDVNVTPAPLVIGRLPSRRAYVVLSSSSSRAVLEVRIKDAAPSSRRGDVLSSLYSFGSFFRSSGSSVVGGSDLKNRPFDPRRLAVPDIDYTALRCRSTDYHP